MDMSKMRIINTYEFNRQSSKTLYRSICVPSVVQSYSLCVEYMKRWFLSKFKQDVFKSIYVDGKYIYDEFRSLSKVEILKRKKPSLTITPSISLDFNDNNIDNYPYGMDMYVQTGKFKESFFSCTENNSYMGLGMEVLLMNFEFKIKVETRAQQLDLYKYINLACRVGFTCGEDVDLDFHIPYELILQLARDNGFNTYIKKQNNFNEEIIENVPEFLRWLNMHSELPFLYKYRTLNGKNEFFIRMRDMYVHIRPTELSADDGDREGQITSNFILTLNAEVRFPAPKMYAYYSDNAHKLEKIYTAWYQPNGPISTCYTFKSTVIPDKNGYGWPLYMSTTYEDNEQEEFTKLIIDLSELFEGDINNCILDCISKGISPSIFCDIMFYNSGEYITGIINWETFKFESDNIVKSKGTYIGIYVDNDFVADYLLHSSNAYNNRISKSSREEV